MDARQEALRNVVGVVIVAVPTLIAGFAGMAFFMGWPLEAVLTPLRGIAGALAPWIAVTIVTALLLVAALPAATERFSARQQRLRARLADERNKTKTALAARKVEVERRIVAERERDALLDVGEAHERLLRQITDEYRVVFDVAEEEVPPAPEAVAALRREVIVMALTAQRVAALEAAVAALRVQHQEELATGQERAQERLQAALQALQAQHDAGRVAAYDRAQESLRAALSAADTRHKAALRDVQEQAQRAAQEAEQLRHVVAEASAARSWREGLALLTFARSTASPNIRATRDVLRAAGFGIPNAEYDEFAASVRSLASAETSGSLTTAPLPHPETNPAVMVPSGNGVGAVLPGPRTGADGGADGGPALTDG